MQIAGSVVAAVNPSLVSGADKQGIGGRQLFLDACFGMNAGAVACELSVIIVEHSEYALVGQAVCHVQRAAEIAFVRTSGAELEQPVFAERLTRCAHVTCVNSLSYSRSA